MQIRKVMVRSAFNLKSMTRKHPTWDAMVKDHLRKGQMKKFEVPQYFKNEWSRSLPHEIKWLGIISTKGRRTRWIFVANQYQWMRLIMGTDKQTSTISLGEVAQSMKVLMCMKFLWNLLHIIWSPSLIGGDPDLATVKEFCWVKWQEVNKV